MLKSFKFAVVMCMVGSLCGCSIILQKRHPKDLQQIDSLSEKLLAEQKQREELLQLKQQLLLAKAELEQRLKREIEEKKVRLQMADKGLVITFIAEVLFDSGKAKIKKNAYSVLSQVADVLSSQVADRNIAIEGHTDNQPIIKSKWKSNWELSTARAISVLHYLEGKAIMPERLSAVGYGEYSPIASNSTAVGRQKNRRVEITILPPKIVKKRK
ncbi:MAG: hypothetical protein DRP78_07415 [Candidatus Omnitrophota bacterium]|nr:MAG: hypothetical protein DRP78_07415 [Candidatus Omnitrophota bacterium]